MNVSRSPLGVLALVLGSSLALATLADCAGSPRCTTGASVECACPGGAKGAQVCAADGTLSTCNCGVPGSGGGGGGAVDAGDGGPGADGGSQDGGYFLIVEWDVNGLSADAGCSEVPNDGVEVQGGSLVPTSVDCTAGRINFGRVPYGIYPLRATLHGLGGTTLATVNVSSLPPQPGVTTAVEQIRFETAGDDVDFVVSCYESDRTCGNVANLHLELWPNCSPARVTRFFTLQNADFDGGGGSVVPNTVNFPLVPVGNYCTWAYLDVNGNNVLDTGDCTSDAGYPYQVVGDAGTVELHFPLTWRL